MGVFLILFVIFLLLIIAYMLFCERKNKAHFESKGIPYVGNATFRVALKGHNLLDNMNFQYKAMKELKTQMIGGKDFGQLSLTVKDTDIIKSVLVKDFDHFVDRRPFAVLEHDIIFNKMLFGIRGDKWKALRSKLSPTFTTGKIKRIFPLFNKSGEKFLRYLEAEMAQNGEVDLDVGFSKFAMDIIATSVCGIDSHAFNQKEPSHFEKMAKLMQFNFTGKGLLKIIVLTTSSKLFEWLGFHFLEPEGEQFFGHAIKSSIRHRHENNEKREDFIQLMLEARHGKLKTNEAELDAYEKDAQIKETQFSELDGQSLLDDDGIIANSILFMLAGFDTTQSVLQFTAYTIGVHQEVQDKLRAEIQQVLKESGGELTYDGLNQLTYLDMVINETLRLYPPAVGTDRGCTREYKVPGTELVLKKDEVITIPIWGLHHDEEFWPDPWKFDPERFSPENKGEINPYVYLPFGQGPRNCIGKRFALAEVKVALVTLIRNFKIEPSQKTLIPMKFSRGNTVKPESLHLAFHKIQY